MKPVVKINRICQEQSKKYLVIYISMFVCMYWPGVSAGATCGRPGRTTMNRFKPLGNEFNVDDKIHYTCAENHVLLGNPDRHCLKNGSWSDDIPVCSKVAFIKKVELNQDYESDDPSSYTIDDDVTTCADRSMYTRSIWRGHLASSINVTAVIVSFIGEKEAQIDVQVLEDDSYAMKRCELKSEEEGFSIKSIQTFTFYCPPTTAGKYVDVSGNNLKFCEISVLHPPNSSCFTPDIPLHGNGYKRTSNEETYYFRCDDGYKRWGSVSVTCQPDGRWLPKSPICRNIYCHTPENIENGYVEYNETKGVIPYNGTATFSCKAGFDLIGKPVLRCQRWEEWDSPLPQCKMRLTESINSVKDHPQTERLRQANETHCGNLPQIANGAFIVNSSHIGSIAWLKCAEGFRPLKEDRIYCLSSGKWSLYSIHCTIIQCETNPVIPYGKAVLLNNSSYYGSPLQILCNEGYTSHTTITRTCDGNGSWGDLNICVEITCGSLNTEDVNNGQWIPVNGSASVYVLICPANFHIEGSPAVIRCLSNGSWSYTSAKCQRSFTSFWGSDWTPSLILIAAVAAGIATAVVIVCFFLSFLVIKKRREAHTNTTVFHLENTSQKDRIKEMNSQRQKHHSAVENYNTVELRCKSVCTFPRKPRSALPNLPVDADPVYAQPFETTTMKKASVTAVNKKDDLYNTHIYAEPVDSRRNTPNHMLVNVDNIRMGTDKRLSTTRTNLENNLSTSNQTSQQNCDKQCAIYDSSRNANLNSMMVTKEENLQSYSANNELGSLKKNLEYLEIL